MSLTPRIAIDAMGGDVGVRMMLAGAAMARHKHEGLRFILVGDEEQIKAAGAEAYVSKPISVIKFIESVGAFA